MKNRIPFLVADDDQILIDDLLAQFDWEEEGFELIGTALNGVQALKLFKKHRPYLIISDIIMPGLTGIELLKEIKNMAPETQVILLTSHDEFQYAKEAIQLNAYDYILKNELNETLIKECTEKIKREYNKKHAFSNIYVQNIIQEYFKRPVNELKDNYNTGYDELSQLKNKKWMALLQVTYHKQDPDGKRRLLHDNLIENVKINFNVKGSMIYRLSNTHILMLYDEEVFPNGQAYYRHCAEIQHNTGTFEDIIVSVLYYPRSIRIDSFHKSVFDMEIFKRNFGRCFGASLVDISRLHEKHELDVKKEGTTLERLINEISGLDIVNIKSSFDSIRSLLKDREGYDFQYDLEAGIRAVLNKTAENNAYHNLTDKTCLSYEEMFEWCIEQAEKINKFISEGKSKLSLNVKKAVDYIGANYMNPELSVEKISEHTYLSISYLCTLFKSEMGVSINGYITDVRINKAKEFLKDPSYKIYHVSEKVGYSSSQYFSQMFYKHTGMTPKEYRKNTVKD